MPFDQNNLPKWNSTGAEPPDSKKDAGFGPGDKPPADWFNWLFNKAYVSIKSLFDNAIHKEEKGKANGVASLGSDGKVPSSQLSVSTPPDASTTTKGVVMLEDSVTSTSTNKAATPNSIKTVNDVVMSHLADFTALRINFINLAIETETMKAAELTGVDANIFIETFQNLDDVVLERGGYDSVNKRLEV